MKHWLNRKGAEALLVLTFDGGNLTARVERKANILGEAIQPILLKFSVGLFSGDPEVLGRELRQQLDAAAIRERACVVGLPLEWVLTRLTTVPDLPAADVESLLEIDAERGFPYPLEELVLGHSRFAVGDSGYALQVAVPRAHVVRLDSILRLGRLEPLSFSLAEAAWNVQHPSSSGGGVRVLIHEHQVVLMINSSSGLACLRHLGDQAREETEDSSWRSDFLSREIRITLGQLPGPLRSDIRHFLVAGDGSDLAGIVAKLGATFSSWELQQESFIPGLGQGRILANAESAALAQQYWAGKGQRLEFLPPRISQWQQLASRYSSRKLAYMGGAAGAIVGVFLLAVAFQEYQLHRLNSRWAAISGRVRDLEEIQQKIRRYRPWYDDSIRSLRILRRVTEAFPEDPSVVAKSLEIHDPGVVTCTGTARDTAALLKVLEALRATREVSEVQVDQARGKSPLQFSFNLRWEGAQQP